jgi:hypothetical protein
MLDTVPAFDPTDLRLQPLSTPAAGGRGLQIVAAVSDASGVLISN